VHHAAAPALLASRGMDLDFGTATELAEALRTRRLSSRELLDHLLARAGRLNAAINAIVAWDIDRAKRAAAAADEATARGKRSGPLHGLPITVKDVWETAGLVTTSGATELSGYVPQSDALAVARLKAAGAIIFGKTNTPPYASDWQTYNDVYGRTSNPWDTSRTAGGSSGGAAAAVAAGLTPLELGSDIGGSIRNPAHCNGVYGLKPSWGVVPVRGHIPGAPGSLVTVDVGVAGPIARSVADLRTAFGVVAGPLPEDAAAWQLRFDPGSELTSVTDLRIATVFGEGADVVPIAADVRASLDAFAARLAAAGAAVESVPLPVPLADGMRTWIDIVSPIFAVGMSDEDFAGMTALESVPGQDLQTLMGRAMVERFRSWLRATDVRQHQRAAWAELFERYDVVLAPVMPTPAFPHDTERPMPERRIDVDGRAVPHMDASAWLCAIGAMLLPVVVLPTGPSGSGLPVGVQVIGPFLADIRLLRISELLEAAAGTRFTPPPLAAG
jgi:amidase